MNPINSIHIRYTIITLFSVLLFSGCSGSGSAQAPAEVNVPGSAQSNSTGDDGLLDNNSDSSSGTMGEVDSQLAAETTGDTAGDTESATTIGNATGTEDAPADDSQSNPVVSDPLAQNITQIEFDITVPVYVSNTLQVGVVWGDKDLAAKWVGDEFWSISDSFPTNTEHLLVVTFYDRNGDITLGSFEKKYKTGVNSSETIQINANQFETNRWDDDSDGKSNIDELIAGTDPLVDDRVQLEVRDSLETFGVNLSINKISGFYESLLPAERPYYVQIDESGPFVAKPFTLGFANNVNIDIDESGTGSFSDKYSTNEPSNNRVNFKIATRTNADGFITWAGTYAQNDSSAAVGEDIEFTLKSSVNSTQERTQEGVFERHDRNSSYRHKHEVTYSLTGKIIENTTMCEPFAGTIVNQELSKFGGDGLIRTTITKEVDELYWKVVAVSDMGQILEEYLLRTLGTDFYCDFNP